MAIQVEFFGIPRQRAGCSTLTVEADTLRQVIHEVERLCPELTILNEGRIVPHYRLSINGERFTATLGENLAPGTRILLLSADVGG